MVAAVNIGFNLKYIQSGGGRHQYYLSAQHEVDASKWSTLATAPFTLATTLTKVSLCFMVIRITNSKPLIRFVWALMALVVVINSACFIVELARCHPIQALWDYSIQGACWSRTSFTAFAYIQGRKISLSFTSQAADNSSLLRHHGSDMHIASNINTLEYTHQ
jgi:hypothetical protein